jgi:hypothetical protein
LDDIEAEVWNSHARKRNRKKKEKKPMECILEEILDEEVSEEVWQRRLEKRQAYVQYIKQTPVCVEVFFDEKNPRSRPLRPHSQQKILGGSVQEVAHTLG